jgi:hypothetical protein
MSQAKPLVATVPSSASVQPPAKLTLSPPLYCVPVGGAVITGFGSVLGAGVAVGVGVISGVAVGTGVGVMTGPDGHVPKQMRRTLLELRAVYHRVPSFAASTSVGPLMPLAKAVSEPGVPLPMIERIQPPP